MIEEHGHLDTIHCSSDCVPACTYWWSTEDDRIASLNELLTLSNVRRDESGTYTCHAANEDMSVSLGATIVVDVTCKRLLKPY